MHVLSILLALAAQQSLTVEVTASKGAKGVPVRLALPEGVDLAHSWRLIGPDGKERPVQFAGREAIWIVENMDPGTKARFRLEQKLPAVSPRVEAFEKDGKILIRVGEMPVLQYNSATVYPPEKYDQAYARNAFIHPIWTPRGRVISNQWPVHHHLHQNGLWLAWKNTVFQGRKISFWDTKSRKAMVEFVKAERSTSGPVFGAVRILQDWEDRSAPGGKKIALKEVWDLRAYASGDAFIFDLVSTQTCASDAPVVNTKMHYGGFAYRGPADWEAKMDYLTDLGKNRKNGNETRARWVVALGKIGGADAQIGFLSHPSNLRAPQPVRLHPKMPYFCFAPSQLGDFTIEPGKPFVSRYRMVVKDGVLSAEDMNRRWAGYSEPPTARLVAGE